MVVEPPLRLSHDHSTKGLMADLAAFTTRFEPYILRYPALWAHWRCDRLLDLMQPAEGPVPEMEKMRGCQEGFSTCE